MLLLDLAAKRAWYKMNFSNSESGLVKINFIGLQLYRNESELIRIPGFAPFHICRVLLKNPALPPESLGQIGFGGDYIRWRLKLEGETENMGVKLRFLVYTTSHGPRTKICAVGILAIA